jgi:sugar/nucleoside kinase (ribokinase family)
LKPSSGGEILRPYIVAIGHTVIDEYYECNHWPIIGDKAIVKHTGSKVGGMVPNAASVISNFGLEIYLLDRIGDDEYTPVILEDLKKFVDMDTQCLNSKTLIMLAEGERTIFVVNDPTRQPIQMDSIKKNLLFNAQYVYTLIPNIKRIPDHRTWIEQLDANRVGLVFDVESESFVSRDEDEYYFNGAGMICFNENAFAKYCIGIDQAQAFNQLLNREDKIIIVTLGANGCLVKTKQLELRIPGIPVKPIDTTGAGDTFIGAFLFGLTQRWDLQRTAVFANAAAARSVLFFGPKAGIASVAEIDKFIKQM